MSRNNCIFWFLLSSKPAALVLPPEQENKGWLAESEREDSACIEQSQTDLRSIHIWIISVLWLVWLDLDFRTVIW